jgi:hypothetical protein
MELWKDSSHNDTQTVLLVSLVVNVGGWETRFK